MALARAPLLPFAAAFAIGIAAAPAIPCPPCAWIAAGGGLCAAALLLLRAGRTGWVALLLLAIFATAGAARHAGPALPADHLARRPLHEPITVEGRLASEPVRWAADRVRLLVDVEAYEDAAGRHAATGRVQLAVHGELPSLLGEGQRVRAHARLGPPLGFRNPGGFDYPAYLRREGILLAGSARGDRVAPLGADDPPWPVRVKRWAIATIRAHVPEVSAALLAGLLLGERAALPRETDEAFRRAGAAHLLAVSGFNVAILTGAVLATLSAIGVPRRAGAVSAGVVLIGFALVVGAQPSVLRAALMGGLLLASAVVERQSQALNALALAGLALLLWSPAELRAPGFQLSFAATAGIIYLAPPLIERLRQRGWPSWIAGAVAVSLAAQLAITPVMAAVFNQLSLIGVLANLVIVPLAAPATMLGMLALVLSPASDLAASLVWNALWLLVVALRAAVALAAAIPNAMVHVPAPGWAAIAAWYAGLGLAPLCASHRPARWAVAGLALAVAGLSVWPWVAPEDDRLRIAFLDVGQGDATLIELPGGRRVLVDGGPGGARRLDAGERVVSPYLWNRPARRLDVVAMSHADQDHAGGLAAVLKHFRVGEFWHGAALGRAAEETRRAVERSGVARRRLTAGDRYPIGDATLTVLNPQDSGGGDNDDSLVLRLDWRGVSLLLTGDIGWEREERLLADLRPVRADVLKVAHHGSRRSSGASFLAAARPAIAVVSAGRRNPFGHPAADAINRLEAAGARVYRTDRDGAVIVESDGARLLVTRWARGTTDVIELGPGGPAGVLAVAGSENQTASGVGRRP